MSIDKVNPVPRDLLLVLRQLLNYYEDIERNPSWVETKNPNTGECVAEFELQQLENESLLNLLWDCNAFFATSIECAELSRAAEFLIGELLWMLRPLSNNSLHCRVFLKEDWIKEIKADVEKYDEISVRWKEKSLKPLIERIEAEFEKQKEEAKESAFRRSGIRFETTFENAEALYPHISKCLRGEIAKFEKEVQGAGLAFEITSLLADTNPIDVQFFVNRSMLQPFFRDFLSQYIAAFKEGQLFDHNVLKWESQKRWMLQLLQDLKEKYGPTFWITRENFDESCRSELADHKAIETLLALHQEGVLRIGRMREQRVSVGNKWEEESGLLEIEITLVDGDLTPKTSEERVSWTGDLSVSYDRIGRKLRIGDQEETIPAKHGDKIELFIELLVDRFNTDDPLPLDHAAFRSAATQEGLQLAQSAIQTAYDALNREVKEKFKLVGFVRREQNCYFIPKE